VDWDWEERPAKDVPPRRAPEGRDPGPAPTGPEPPQAPPAPERDVEAEQDATLAIPPGPSTQGEQAPGAYEIPSHEPPSEYVLPDRTDTGRPAPLSDAELERPRTRTIEAAERAAVAGAGPDDYDRPPRSPQDRAARREQRRRQLRRRRLVALAILIAIVVLIVVLVIRGCGGSDAAAAAFFMIGVDGRFLVAPGQR
jgi:hypothetical protein